MIGGKKGVSSSALEKRQEEKQSAQFTGKGGGKGKLESCHPSVCVGGAQPTSCICPTTKK